MNKDNFQQKLEKFERLKSKGLENLKYSSGPMLEPNLMLIQSLKSWNARWIHSRFMCKPNLMKSVLDNAYIA
jgi:hypothetical protein